VLFSHSVDAHMRVTRRQDTRNDFSVHYEVQILFERR
jgi:hypothetical protein